jgi:hypothetical protein
MIPPRRPAGRPPRLPRGGTRPSRACSGRSWRRSSALAAPAGFRVNAASRATDAAECRPSCSLITGNPAAAASTRNRRETLSGSQGEPSARQKIRSLSAHAVDARRRAASRARRWVRRSVIVMASSQMRRSLPLVFGRPSVTSPPICSTVLCTVRYPASRSAPAQRNPSTSPRRAPRSSRRASSADRSPGSASATRLRPPPGPP